MGLILKDDWESFPNIDNYSIPSYGVCDSADQFMEKFGYELENSKERYIVSFTPVYKKEQPEEHGWRWKKWGEYIGTQEPQADYLADEPTIEMIYVFEIFQQKNQLAL